MKTFKNIGFFMVNTLICFSSCGALAQAVDIAFKSELDGSKQYYMEMLPDAFDKNKTHDLIIGLHGHGSDRKQFALDGRPECKSFRKFATKHNMIVVSPDYRAKTSWMGPAAEADLVQIIKELKAKYKINKVFLVGGSMGAASALTFAAMHPERLTMPIAFTTGGKDKSVPPVSVKRLFKILKKLNRKVLLIHRPSVSHSTSFADGMAAMEFMFTGIAKIPAKTETIASNSSSKASVIQVEAEAGKGGIFFAQSNPPAEGKGLIDLGLRFYAEKTGKIEAFCFYQSKNESGKHVFKLWNTNGQLLLVVNVSTIEKEGWVKVPLAKPFAISASTEYILAYTCNKAYPAEANGFRNNIKRNGFIALEGHYSIKDSGAKAPDKTYKKMNYFIDIIFSCED